jgi:hypothetical protein
MVNKKMKIKLNTHNLSMKKKRNINLLENKIKNSILKLMVEDHQKEELINNIKNLEIKIEKQNFKVILKLKIYNLISLKETNKTKQKKVRTVQEVQINNKRLIKVQVCYKEH